MSCSNPTTGSDNYIWSRVRTFQALLGYAATDNVSLDLARNRYHAVQMRQLHTTKEVAEMYGMHEVTVRRMLADRAESMPDGTRRARLPFGVVAEQTRPGAGWLFLVPRELGAA